jgi:hypothetical protein
MDNFIISSRLRRFSLESIQLLTTGEAHEAIAHVISLIYVTTTHTCAAAPPGGHQAPPDLAKARARAVDHRAAANETGYVASWISTPSRAMKAAWESLPAEPDGEHEPGPQPSVHTTHTTERGSHLSHYRLRHHNASFNDIS